jgi:tetratricopeptide (TPR) repeat protein
MRIKASHVLNSQKLAAVWLGACLCLSANLLPKSGLSAWAAKKEKPAAQAEQVGPPEAAKQESPADQAITLFNQGVELFQVGQVQAEKGNLNGQRQLLREAVKRFEQALALDSTMVDAQSNIGLPTSRFRIAKEPSASSTRRWR